MPSLFSEREVVAMTEYFTICQNCFRRWEEGDATVWQLDAECRDPNCEVFRTYREPTEEMTIEVVDKGGGI